MPKTTAIVVALFIVFFILLVAFFTRNAAPSADSISTQESPGSQYIDPSTSLNPRAGDGPETVPTPIATPPAE